MSFTFNGHSIVTDTGETIPLKFVESIRVGNDEELVVDKLKGDVTLLIRSLSGQEYTVSMSPIPKLYKQDNSDLAQAIYDKWLWIHKPN